MSLSHHAMDDEAMRLFIFGSDDSTIGQLPHSGKMRGTNIIFASAELTDSKGYLVVLVLT